MRRPLAWRPLKLFWLGPPSPEDVLHNGDPLTQAPAGAPSGQRLMPAAPLIAPRTTRGPSKQTHGNTCSCHERGPSEGTLWPWMGAVFLGLSSQMRALPSCGFDYKSCTPHLSSFIPGYLMMRTIQSCHQRLSIQCRDSAASPVW